MGALYIIQLSKRTFRGLLAATVLSATSAFLAYKLANEVLLNLGIESALLFVVLGEGLGTFAAGAIDLWKSRKPS